ncbi:dolichol phosphate-mannose biosynthesis regulatory [Globomyces pollinis-pini]|nr:dolichol phosphate-mannose biosynthesis regulatory [Globomyces pollinis-pini]
MSMSDKSLGFLIWTLSVTFFIYYFIWLFITPFLPSNHMLQSAFLDYELGIFIPVFLFVCAVSLIGFYLSFILIKASAVKRS